MSEEKPTVRRSLGQPSREIILRRELDAERHRNRHLVLLTESMSEMVSRLAVENYELRYGRRYPVHGKGLSPLPAVGLGPTEEAGGS